MHSIILFAKAPVPGKVKTRLTTNLSPHQSAALHESFVIDTLMEMSVIKDADTFLACHPTSEDPFFLSLEKRFHLNRFEQRGQNLGERMKNAFHHLKSQGYDKIVIIGSDSPTLSGSIVEEAFESLEKHDLVLGPSLDGGYYLIAISGEVPEIFNGIQWGGDTVFEDTFNKAKSLGLDMHILPFWYDVDTIKELRFLSIHLAGLDDRVCVETRNVLARIGKTVCYP
ncbi:MAG: TIGR04282 family arsenosugar biosynthesis glycosyltransferase [Deltaproteobacteria bacterium]|nr:TIGR04282 family arsenosugar biosynthesis glycosyltransferase [Deltaproteobacteria bacterium]